MSEVERDLLEGGQLKSQLLIMMIAMIIVNQVRWVKVTVRNQHRERERGPGNV